MSRIPRSSIKRVSWIIGPDGESELVDINSSGGWVEMADNKEQQVLQLTVTDTQPTAQRAHITNTPTSCKPMQLRTRPRSRKEHKRLIQQEEGVVGKDSGSRMAWSYDKIMKCCGRF